MHLVGFIIKKFVSMHSHMNVKKNQSFTCGRPNSVKPSDGCLLYYLFSASPRLFRVAQSWDSPLHLLIGEDGCQCQIGNDENQEQTHMPKDIIHDCALKPPPQKPVFLVLVKVKVKQSRYRPGVAQRVPGS